MTMRKTLFLGSALVLLAGAAFAAGKAPAASSGTDWQVTGHDAGGQRYSPLTQINKSNVTQLKQAWSYHLTPAGYQGRPRLVEATPLVIGNTMIITSTYGQVIALDATTGAEKWKFDLPDKDTPSAHGSAYSPYAKAIIFGSRLGRLYSLDLATGKPSASFGDAGIVNMKTPETMVTGPTPVYDLPSPGVIYKNLIITGAGTPDGGPNYGPRGDTRAWDAKTGKLVWAFHTV